MHSILIDTSTEKCFAAIGRDTEIIFCAPISKGLQSAQAILPELQKGLQETGLDLKDVSFIAVSIGPGSYTGMRIGVTIAKTLAFAKNTPLIGVCSLDLFVPKMGEEVEAPKNFAAVIDAKIGGLYVQTGTFHEGKGTRVSAPGVYSLSQAAELLQNVPMIVTPNAIPWRPKLEALVPTNHWVWEENSPSPIQLLSLAQEKYIAKEYSLDSRLELLYMRKTQAEIEKEKASLL